MPYDMPYEIPTIVGELIVGRAGFCCDGVRAPSFRQI